jgi:hypothetical protein
MAVGNVGVATRSPTSATNGFKRFLGRYFYFSMALLMAGLSVWGFSQTVDARLLHATPPRPLLLWFHAAAFSGWIVLFVVQSALVRVRKVSVHRTLGWVGTALAATMIASSFSVSVVMVRFDRTALGKDVSSFLSVLWCDMIIFAACMVLAIYFRKRPEYHRRLVFVASCQLMQAAFVRFQYVGNHGARRADRRWNVARPRSGWATQQGLSLRLAADDCSAGLGHVPGAGESELVASRDARDSRVVKLV